MILDNSWQIVKSCQVHLDYTDQHMNVVGVSECGLLGI